MALMNLEHGNSLLSHRVSPKHHVQVETSIEIAAADAPSIQQEITGAVEKLLANANPEDRRGIMVTRHTLTSFTVSLSWDVPPRTTHERDLSERSTMSRVLPRSL